MATSPSQLDQRIDIVLEELVDVFGSRALKINWAPGKSAAMLKYRGKRAHAHVNARRDQEHARQRRRET